MKSCRIIFRAGILLFLCVGSSLVTNAATKNQVQNLLSIRQQNKQALAELQKAIDERYSYRDYRKINWNSVYRVYGPRIEQARTPQEFAERAAGMLGKNKDLHLRLEVGGKRYATYQPKINRNYSIRTLAKMVPNWQRKNNCVCTGRYSDGIGYILIASWSTDRKEELEAVFAALKEFEETSSLIIDVRPNGGGSEVLAREVAGCFVDKPKVYSKNVNRIPGPEQKFTGLYERIVTPSKNRPHYQGNVVVLMGQNCMSSNESFLLMMKQAPKCQLIGEKSYGSSGNPHAVELGNGVTVFLPSWKDCFPDGTCFEDKGITPDITVKADAMVFKKRDPVLERALKVLMAEKKE